MNRRNSCKTRIVWKECFVRFVSVLWKTSSQNAFAGGGGFLMNSKNFFAPFSVATHIRKNCGLWRIVCRPLFVTFRKTQFFLRKSSFIIVCKQRRIKCSRLKDSQMLFLGVPEIPEFHNQKITDPGKYISIVFHPLFVLENTTSNTYTYKESSFFRDFGKILNRFPWIAKFLAFSIIYPWTL